MTKNIINKKILMITLLAVLGIATPAVAQWEMGQHHFGGMHHGPGWQYGPRGYDSWGNLSEDEIKQIKEECKAFFEATKEIRQQLYQKRLEIRSELAKMDPDAEIAADLQKEISDLRAQMGRKRLDHILKLKKINPDVGRGLMGRGRMGFGMMGPGGYSGCPNCPYQGYGSGYGMGTGLMGPGIMGQGMMGLGRGGHMMPGWSGRNYPLPYQQGKRPLERSNK